MKCKVINSSKTLLEQHTNEWLKTGKYEIINMLQTQDDTYITLTIIYLELKEIREKKLEKLNNINK